MRSGLMCLVHVLLGTHGIQIRHSDRFGKDGCEFLTAPELRDPPRQRLDDLLRLIDDLEREIDLLA